MFFFSLGMHKLSFIIFTGAQLPRLGFLWSQIPLMIGIWNPRSIDKEFENHHRAGNWESTGWNQEPKTVLDYFTYWAIWLLLVKIYLLSLGISSQILILKCDIFQPATMTLSLPSQVGAICFPSFFQVKVGKNLYADHFEESVRMSTYLVAFLVSDFKSIETNTGSGIKVC